MARELVKKQTGQKNLLINGAFEIWQRGTSFTSTGAEYTADRWRKDDLSSSVCEVTRQTWAEADDGYSDRFGDYYLRLADGSTATGTMYLVQRIEDVKTAAGKYITVSVRAKASSEMNLNLEVRQNFGSGGSTEVITDGGDVTVGTEWATYSFQVLVPGVSGKTIGTSSYLQIGLNCEADGSGAVQIDLDWVTCYEGQYATETKYQRYAESYRDELDECSKFYLASVNRVLASPQYNSTTALGRILHVFFPVIMRATPTVTTTPNSGWGGSASLFYVTEQQFAVSGGASAASSGTWIDSWTADAEL